MPTAPTLRATLPILLCVCAVGGCRFAINRDGEVIRATNNRNPVRAARQQEKGVKLVRAGKLAEAEAAFESALLADETYGPAQNNLGLVHFARRDLYSAAWAFQRAIEMMPERPEPHNNLGLTLEAGGRLDEAVFAYQNALDRMPDNPEYLGNLIRARLKRGDSVESVRIALRQLLFIETRPEWIIWAEEQLALFLRDPESSEPSLPEEIDTPDQTVEDDSSSEELPLPEAEVPPPPKPQLPPPVEPPALPNVPDSVPDPATIEYYDTP